MSRIAKNTKRNVSGSNCRTLHTLRNVHWSRQTNTPGLTYVRMVNLAICRKMISVWTGQPGCFKKFPDFVRILT